MKPARYLAPLDLKRTRQPAAVQGGTPKGNVALRQRQRQPPLDNQLGVFLCLIKSFRSGLIFLMSTPHTLIGKFRYPIGEKRPSKTTGAGSAAIRET
jgi:hypothetical protein